MTLTDKERRAYSDVNVVCAEVWSKAISLLPLDDDSGKAVMPASEDLGALLEEARLSVVSEYTDGQARKVSTTVKLMRKVWKQRG